MAMTKRDLVIHVARRTGLPQCDVARVVDAAFQTLCKALAEGKRWELRNFGVLQVKTRAARIGRNPQTGETIQISPRRVLTFKPSQVLRDGVNHTQETDV